MDRESGVESLDGEVVASELGEIFRNFRLLCLANSLPFVSFSYPAHLQREYTSNATSLPTISEQRELIARDPRSIFGNVSISSSSLALQQLVSTAL